MKAMHGEDSNAAVEVNKTPDESRPGERKVPKRDAQWDGRSAHRKDNERRLGERHGVGEEADAVVSAKEGSKAGRRARARKTSQSLAATRVQFDGPLSEAVRKGRADDGGRGRRRGGFGGDTGGAGGAGGAGARDARTRGRRGECRREAGRPQARRGRRDEAELGVHGGWMGGERGKGPASCEQGGGSEGSLGTTLPDYAGVGLNNVRYVSLRVRCGHVYVHLDRIGDVCGRK